MRTQDAKKIPIPVYLEKIGAKFARRQHGTHGLEYVYHSPQRNDAKPSLCVNIARNIWSDVPVGAGGGILELVCHIHHLPDTDISGALAVLDRLFSGYSLPNSSVKQPKTQSQLPV